MEDNPAYQEERPAEEHAGQTVILSPGTARYDRGYKKDTYARCGVREYWIADPANKTLEQYLLRGGRLEFINSFALLPDWIKRRMTPAETAAVTGEFRCSLYGDLTISLEEVFARVP